MSRNLVSNILLVNVSVDSSVQKNHVTQLEQNKSSLFFSEQGNRMHFKKLKPKLNKIK